MTTPFDIDLGLRIAEVRMDRGLTQDYFAALIGTSGRNERRYEKGESKIPSSRLDEIAMWLQCETVRLLEPPGSPIPRRRCRIEPVADYEDALISICKSFS